MSTSNPALTDKDIPVATFAPARPSDLRSPCPFVNCLANHGFLPRDGRHMSPEDLSRGFEEAGFGSVLGSVATKLIFGDRTKDTTPTTALGRLWARITLPIKGLFKFSLHVAGQTNSKTGKKSINLDQLGDTNQIEHDISLTRHDRAQGDCLTRQPDMVAQLIASSSDGGKTITTSDLAALRMRRIHEQKEINPETEYGKFQHTLACGEISLLLNVVGDGQRVKCDYVKAVFEEERIPYEEGWEKKTGSKRIGILQVLKTSARARKTMGLTFNKP